jgi:hypothetical protein
MSQKLELTSEGLCILVCEPCPVPGNDCEACELYALYLLEKVRG